jgi:hypothetical protein
MPTPAALEQQGTGPAAYAPQTPARTRLSTLPGMTPAQLNDRGFDSVRASRTAGRLTGLTGKSTSIGASPSPPSSAWMDAAWDETSPQVRWDSPRADSPRTSAASAFSRPTLGGGVVQHPPYQHDLQHRQGGQKKQQPATALFQDPEWMRLSARTTAQSAPPVPAAAVLRASSRTGSTGRSYDEPRSLTFVSAVKRLVAFIFLGIVAYALATLIMDPTVRVAVTETFSQLAYRTTGRVSSS